MKYNKPSGCGCNSRLDSYIDLNRVKVLPWEDVDTIIGMTNCGDVVPVAKPEYELTEIDRDKLDAIVIDGSGDLFLANDGTYKSVRTDLLENMILEFDENPANFVIRNAEKLALIKEMLDEGLETFVRIEYNQYVLPVSVGYSANQLILEYDAVNYPLGALRAEFDYQRLKILIVLNTTTTPPTVVTYQISTPTDADYIIDVTGDGTKSLFDDGVYKAVYTTSQVYTKEEVDALVEAGSVDAVLYNANDDVELRNNIILKNDANLLGTTLTGTTINLIQCSRFTDSDHPIVDIGSTTAHMTFNSYDRPNVQLVNETGNHFHEMAYLNEVEAVQSDVDGLQIQVTAVSNLLNDTITSTESALLTINDELSNMDARIDTNTENIAINAADIEALRDEVTSAEKFRGYFDTINEVTALPDPTPGDYAWVVETGTVWTYNGTTWYNTTVAIPDQTVVPYDATPLMAGVGDAGESTRYSRGDHRHPSDTTKADVTDLLNYLSLSGNTQTTRISGDIWLSTGQKYRFTNSGNSYIGQNSDSNTTELVGNGVGGINLITANGTAKYNGSEIAVKSDVAEVNADLSALTTRVSTAEGSISSLQTLSASNQSRISSVETRLSDTESDILDIKGQVSYYGVSIEQIIFPHLDDLEAKVTDLQPRVSANETAIGILRSDVDQNTSNISGLQTQVSTNTSDIASIQAALSETDHFRGYYQTTAEVTAIPNPTSGDFAWNGQTGTVWNYNGTTWLDTTNPIPSDSIDAYSGLPLMDGTADAGSVNEYSRGNHRHPTDTSRASVSSVTDLTQVVSTLSDDFQGYVTSNDVKVNDLITRTAVSENNISNLQGRVASVETITADLAPRVAANESSISSIGGRVSTIETNVAGLVQSVSANTANTAALTVRVENLETNVGTLQGKATTFGTQINDLTVEVSDLGGRVAVNESDIASLKSANEERQHFRGYYTLTSQITALVATQGDYAWNAETGTVWVFNQAIPSWQDSGEAIPAGAVQPSNVLPLVNGVADAGTGADYSRFDHVHPIDMTRASVVALTDTNNRVTVLETASADYEDRITVLEAFTETDPVFDAWLSSRTIGSNTDRFAGWFGSLQVSGGISVTGSNTVSLGNSVNLFASTISPNGITAGSTVGTLSNPYAEMHANALYIGGTNKTAEINAIQVTGTGDLALFDDGTYKAVVPVVSGGYLPLSGGILTGDVRTLNVLPQTSNTQSVGTPTSYYAQMCANLGIFSQLEPRVTGGTFVGSTDNPYVDGNIQNIASRTGTFSNSLTLRGVSVATVSDIPDITGFVTQGTDQTISGDKEFTGALTRNGVEVATVNDIPDTSNIVTTDTDQTISGGKNFIGTITRDGLEVAVAKTRFSAYAVNETAIVLPIDVEVSAVIVGRMMLYSDEYSISGSILRITSQDVIDSMQSDTRIEVVYYV